MKNTKVDERGQKFIGFKIPKREVIIEKMEKYQKVDKSGKKFIGFEI